jgi:hypothetical protein
MKALTLESVQELLRESEPPCLSLYMTTHKTHPDNVQDTIRFQNLVKQLEESLLLQYSTPDVKKLLEPFETLYQNAEFWNHTSEGLAVLVTRKFFEVFRLPVPVIELAIVADSLHTKPLRHYLQSVEQYHVLGLSRQDIRLFEGNRHSLAELVLHSDIPKTITEALGEELTEKHLTVASHGGTRGESSNIRHGHGGKKDEVDNDAERFFRVVATHIENHYSKPTGWPLILAALPEHHDLFQKVNKNPLLMPKGISINPEAVSLDSLSKMAWEVMQPAYLLKLLVLTDTYEQAKANGLGSDNADDVIEAASSGRVDTLLLEAGRVIAQRIRNKSTGTFQTTDLTQPRLDDLLDEIGVLVLRMGGAVTILPPEKMPTQTGLAATYRY